MGVCQSCNIISLTHENILFERKTLGEHEPEQLLRNVIYMLGLHLALRGGVEHLRLRRPGFNPQITTELDGETEKEILVYHEDPLQKTNQGRLDSKPHTKIVKVFPSANPKRCPVKLYGKFIGLLPNSKSCGKLYLRPKAKMLPNLWYCDQPYGKNKIGSTVKTICQMANLEGKFTNHSLRATSATRMFVKDVPEQVIKDITGHRSDCVHVYKRTGSELLENASKSIGGNENKNAKIDSENNKNLQSIGDLACEENREKMKNSLTALKMIKNVVRTSMELCKKRVKRIVSKIAKKLVMSKK